MNKLTSFLIVFLLIGLTDCGTERTYPPMTEDFCSQIERPDFPGLSYYTDSLPDDGSGVYILEEGDEAMSYRAWLTESAEKQIDIQYFIFSADNIGLISLDYLLRAADRGVQIRLLVDDIMVEADVDKLLALNAHHGVEIKIYNPTANIGKTLSTKLTNLMTDFKGFNQRMHNKTFIVDQKAAITGGRNIADEYFDYNREYNFRDRDMLLFGDITSSLHSSFETYWNHPLSVSVTDLLEEPEEGLNEVEKYEWLRQYACSPENYWPEIRERVNSMDKSFLQLQEEGELVWLDDVQFVADEPSKNADTGMSGGGVATDSLISLIEQADSTVYIQSPYLVTTTLGQGLLQSAIERGVEIKILTNSLMSTDNLEAFAGYQRDREKLLNMGVEIYEFKPDAKVRYEIMTGFLQKTIDYAPVFGLHAKSMVIDGKIAVVGTFNLDPRSANLNTECITIVSNENIAGELEKVMLLEFQPENAWHTTMDFNPDEFAPWSKRVGMHMRKILPKSIL